MKEVEKILDEIIDVGDPDGRLRRGETSKVTKTNGSEKEKGGSGEFNTTRTGVRFVVSWLMLG